MGSVVVNILIENTTKIMLFGIIPNGVGYRSRRQITRQIICIESYKFQKLQ